MNFDHITPYYDFLASLVFFGSIKNSQVECLRAVPPRGNVLIIGGGTGWIIPYIFENGHAKKLYYVEASKKMLEKAKGKCPVVLQRKIEFILGDETTIPDQKYDAIITNFFLDCFKEERLRRVMSILYYYLKPGGYWYITDFKIGQAWYRRLWQKPLLELMSWFFKQITRLESRYLIDFEFLFREFEMDRIYEQYHYWCFIRSSSQAKPYKLS